MFQPRCVTRPHGDQITLNTFYLLWLFPPMTLMIYGANGTFCTGHISGFNFGTEGYARTYNKSTRLVAFRDTTQYAHPTCRTICLTTN